MRGGRLGVLARCDGASVASRLRGVASGRSACDRHVRLRVPRRLPRTLDVIVSNGSRRWEPARFRLRRYGLTSTLIASRSSIAR